MKVINTRQELAQYVNIKKVACVSINTSNITNDEWKYAKGSRIRTIGRKGIYTEGNVYVEKGKFYISSNGAMLTNGTNIDKYRALEMMEWSNTPIVQEGDEVVVIMYNDESDDALALLLEVGKVDIFCSTACELF